MITPDISDKLAVISERVTRMDERQVADSARIADLRASIEKLDKRLADVEHARAWFTGIMAAVAAVLGWIAKTFTLTTGGKP